MPRPLLKTALCEILGIEYPILLAGMGSRGKTTGEYSCSGSMSLYLAASVALLKKLEDASTSGRVADVDFDVLELLEQSLSGPLDGGL